MGMMAQGGVRESVVVERKAQGRFKGADCEFGRAEIGAVLFEAGSGAGVVDVRVAGLGVAERCWHGEHAEGFVSICIWGQMITLNSLLLADLRVKLLWVEEGRLWMGMRPVVVNLQM